jgi:ABC-type transporter MlaC component
MKKYIILLLFAIVAISMTSCSTTEPSDVGQNTIKHSTIVKAQELFKADSCTNMVIVKEESYDYVVDKNLVVTHKYFKDYNTGALITTCFFSFVSIIVGIGIGSAITTI